MILEVVQYTANAGVGDLQTMDFICFPITMCDPQHPENVLLTGAHFAEFGGVKDEDKKLLLLFP